MYETKKFYIYAYNNKNKNVKTTVKCVLFSNKLQSLIIKDFKKHIYKQF